MTFKDNQVTVFGVCLLAGLTISAMILGNSLVTFKKLDTQKISVTGAASQLITSNYGTWQGRVTCRANTMGAAYTQLKGQIAHVRKFLNQHGIDNKSIEEGTVNTNTIFSKDIHGNYTNTVESYELNQAVTVASENVKQIDSIAKDSNELMTQGITFVSDQPQYFYTKLDSLKVKMLGDATQNARQRAQSMAKSTDNEVGFMTSAQMGVFQITDPNSTEVSDSGISDTQAIEKKVMAVVNVSFEIH